MNKDHTDSKIILPTGEESYAEELTERALERKRENEEFISVIIKRNDESIRHPDDTLEKAILEGQEQIRRPPISLFTSAVAAGLILGFTAMAVAFASLLGQSVESDFFRRFIIGLFYPLGFVICIMSGTQLFTEHTALAVYPVLDRKEKMKDLMRLWGIIISGNLLGTLAIAFLLYNVDGVLGLRGGYVAIFEHFIDYTPSEILLSATLAGWLMAQGGWLILSTPPSFGQIVCIYVVTFLIGIAGFHHSIAGSAEVFIGLLFENGLHLGKSLFFLLIAIIGNTIGGSVFVAILNYSHIKQTQVE